MSEQNREQTLDLSNLAGGKANEDFVAAVREVVASYTDPALSAKAERTVTLVARFKWDGKGRGVQVTHAVTTKLPAREAIESAARLVTEDGVHRMVAESDAEQLPLLQTTPSAPKVGVRPRAAVTLLRPTGEARGDE